MRVLIGDNRRKSRHSDGNVKGLKPAVRSWSHCADKINRLWDKPVVPMPQVERQLLPDADVQRLSLRKAQAELPRALAT